MTVKRPSEPGWYWCQLLGSRPLQPVLVFDSGRGLWYTFNEITYNEDDKRDGLMLDLASKNFTWSDEPIPMPDQNGGEQS